MTRRLVSSRWTVPLAGLVTLLAFAILYIGHQPAYLVLMKVLIKVPAPRAFVDWEWIPSAVRCWADGVDVYVNNTCYQVWPDQSYNYSPLWLRATFLRTGESWTVPAVLAMTVLVLLSLASLPTPRTWRDQGVLLFTAVSSGTILGVERGNADLLIFLLVIAALNLRRLPLPFRLFGYALVVLAGLLKFYPFVALVVVLRERLGVLVAVGLASVAALAGLVLAYPQEVAAMGRNLPGLSVYTLQFGAADLPAGLGATAAKLVGLVRPLDDAAARSLAGAVARGVLPVLVAGALVVALLLARRLGLPSALARMPSRRGDFLLVGATLMVGCFFAGQSVIYRGMYLLLALPGLAALSHDLPGVRGRRLIRLTCLAIPVVMWQPLFESILFVAGFAVRGPYQGDILEWFPRLPAGYALWLATEAAWWSIMTVLLAIVGSFVVRAQVWQQIRRPFSRTTAPI